VFPVVYRRRGKNHESFALICPPDCTSLFGGESMCRLETSGRDHNSGSVTHLVFLGMSYLEVKTEKQCQRKTATYCFNNSFVSARGLLIPGKTTFHVAFSEISLLTCVSISSCSFGTSASCAREPIVEVVLRWSEMDEGGYADGQCRKLL